MKKMQILGAALSLASLSAVCGLYGWKLALLLWLVIWGNNLERTAKK